MHWLSPLSSPVPPVFICLVRSAPFFCGGIFLHRVAAHSPVSSHSLSHLTEPQHYLPDLFGSKSTPFSDRHLVLLSMAHGRSFLLCEKSKLTQKGGGGRSEKGKGNNAECRERVEKAAAAAIRSTYRVTGRTDAAAALAAAAEFFRPSFLLILLSPLFASPSCHAFLSQTDCPRIC